jgi:hypothetical protein
MTTHFSNGVTNVRGKDGATSLFSGIKQPLITGGYNQEVAYQNDWLTFNDEDFNTTITGSGFILPQYAGGWLRIGDNAPAAGEDNGIASGEVWQFNSSKQWWFETRVAVTDVSELNFFVGFAVDGYTSPAALPSDCIGFSHLEDTTSIQFLSRKNAAGTSFDMTDTAGGGTFAMLDSTIPTQTATVFAQPTNSVRLGFHYQPAGSETGVTANQYKLYLNGNKVGTQLATTNPDDIALEMNMFIDSKGTTANHLAIDWFQTIQQR